MFETGHADENRRRRAIVDRHDIAPGAADIWPGPRGDELAVGIEHNQAALTSGAGRTVGARRAATMTQPLFSIVIAVVKPMPPGHCARCWGNFANSVVFLVPARCAWRNCVSDSASLSLPFRKARWFVFRAQLRSLSFALRRLGS